MKKFFTYLMTLIMAVSLCACGTDTPQPSEKVPDVQFTSDIEDWKVGFEASLLEQYGVTPDRYEDLGEGIFQVYVTIGGNSVPFVTVDSATGEYHG